MTAPPYNEQDHVDHARHNEAFLDSLIEELLPTSSTYSDWALVVTFYAALHYTKAAILRDHNETAPHHVTKYDAHGALQVGHNDLVREHLSVINVVYRDLFNIGHEARYRGFYKAPGDGFAEVKRQRKVLSNIKLACGY